VGADHDRPGGNQIVIHDEVVAGKPGSDLVSLSTPSHLPPSADEHVGREGGGGEMAQAHGRASVTLVNRRMDTSR
jgi:hypothetical protein